MTATVRTLRQDDAVGPEVFRELMGSFPVGVVVVTARDRAGTPYGATCSTLTSVTLDPPTLLVCLQDGSTLRSLGTTRAFAVNLLNSTAARTAGRFSSALDDKFADVSWRWRDGLPHLHVDAFAVATCQMTDLIRVGDHTIVLGQVVGSAVRHPSKPLLYRRRRFLTLSEDNQA